MDRREFLKIAIVTPFTLSLFPQILTKDEGKEGLIFVSYYPYWFSEFAQMKLFSFAPISKDTFLANYPFKDRVPDIIELNDALSVKSLAVETKQADCLVIGLPKPEKQLYMAEAIARQNFFLPLTGLIQIGLSMLYIIQKRALPLPFPNL